MAHHYNTSEAPKKKPSTSESVDSLINKKQSEKEAEVSASAEAKMSGVQEDIAEVMGGAEKPSEKVSEKKGESGEKGDLKTGFKSDDDAQAAAISFSIKDYHFPSEEIMIKKIRTAITAQIKVEWQKAKKASGNIGSGGSSQYNESIAKIRSLKLAISSIFSNTVHLIKEMYVKYFTPDGKRRSAEDIQ